MNRSNILDLINEGDICCEIGVWTGRFSEEILKKNPSILHLIDPWVHQDYKCRVYSTYQKIINSIYSSVLNKFQDVDNVKIHRIFSEDAPQLFEDEYFDFLYIDGNHGYKHVMNDILLYLPKVKINGYICGDDYWWQNKDMGNSYSVKEAVDIILPNCTIENNQFIYQKKKEDLWRFYLLSPTIEVKQFNIVI